VQAVQPTNTRRRLTIGPPPQLEKPAQPRKVFADRLLCRSFTFLQGGSGECRVTAGVPWFDSFWHSESIVTVLPPTRQVCGLLCYQVVPSPIPGKLTETRSGLWHNPVGKVHDSPRPAERDNRCEGSAT
jgi:hypothetical protein